MLTCNLCGDKAHSAQHRWFFPATASLVITPDSLFLKPLSLRICCPLPHIRSIRADTDRSLTPYEAEEEKSELHAPSPEVTTTTTTTTRAPTDLDAAFAQIREDLIGRLDPISTPFGPKPLVCE